MDMMRSVGTLTRADLAETINRKLGFSRAFAPEAARGEGSEGLSLTAIPTLGALVADIVARSTGSRLAESRGRRQDG